MVCVKFICGSVHTNHWLSLTFAGRYVVLTAIKGRALSSHTWLPPLNVPEPSSHPGSLKAHCFLRAMSSALALMILLIDLVRVSKQASFCMGQVVKPPTPQRPKHLTKGLSA